MKPECDFITKAASPLGTDLTPAQEQDELIQELLEEDLHPDHIAAGSGLAPEEAMMTPDFLRMYKRGLIRKCSGIHAATAAFIKVATLDAALRAYAEMTRPGQDPKVVERIAFGFMDRGGHAKAIKVEQEKKVVLDEAQVEVLTRALRDTAALPEGDIKDLPSRTKALTLREYIVE